jgi:hypothetical protein
LARSVSQATRPHLKSKNVKVDKYHYLSVRSCFADTESQRLSSAVSYNDVESAPTPVIRSGQLITKSSRRMFEIRRSRRSLHHGCKYHKRHGSHDWVPIRQIRCRLVRSHSASVHLTSIREAQKSTQLNRSMKRLTWVTLGYLLSLRFVLAR